MSRKLTRAGHGSQRPDCVAEDAVSCEPVSAPNSLLTGKLTGNFAKSGPPPRFSCLISARIQELTVEFPTPTEQGIFKRVSGNVFRGTGNFNRGSKRNRTEPQTWRRRKQTSALFTAPIRMSAFGGKADMSRGSEAFGLTQMTQSGQKQS